MPSTKPLTTKDLDDTAKAAKVEKPIPSQATADDIREDAAATSAEPAPKAKAKSVNPDAPYPTQADLDAMKEGRFSNREVTADAGGATYKTR